MESAISSTSKAFSLVNSAIRDFDFVVLDYLEKLRTPFLTGFFFVMTHFADFIVGMLVLLIAALALRFFGYHKDIIPLVVVVAGSAITSELLKLLFLRERPENAVYFEPTFSFPSTHTAVSIALYGFLAFLAMKRISSRTIALSLATLLVIIAALVSFSRLYLGVHYMSDVFGGFLIAVFWLVISLRLDQFLSKENDEKKNN